MCIISCWTEQKKNLCQKRPEWISVPFLEGCGASVIRLELIPSEDSFRLAPDVLTAMKEVDLPTLSATGFPKPIKSQKTRDQITIESNAVLFRAN